MLCYSTIVNTSKTSSAISTAILRYNGFPEKNQEVQPSSQPCTVCPLNQVTQTPLSKL